MEGSLLRNSHHLTSEHLGPPSCVATWNTSSPLHLRRAKQLLVYRASKESGRPIGSSPKEPETVSVPEPSNSSSLPSPSPSPSSSQLDGGPPLTPLRIGNSDLGAYERLFSNLNEANLQHEPGSLSSAVLLIAGTTVGAGILAIPAVTQEAGFFASSITCILCWIYMVITGLLIAEVNVNTMCELGSGGVSLVSMAMRTLGRTGVWTACASYLFIHYALLVAYVARSSDIMTNTLDIPRWLSAALFSGAFGSLCYFGSQRVIGAANGVLVVAIIASFTLLLVAAGGDLHWDSLLQANFEAIPKSIPIIALSFVYQNVVPVVCTNLEGDLKRIRSAVVFGTAIPLVMFLVWDAVILGSLSGVTKVTDPLMALRSTNATVGPIIEVFSLLAIATSYIGFVLGLGDFLADLLKLQGDRGRPAVAYFLSVFPPFVLALLNPDIFFRALDFAGTYGVLVLFGILPATMAWRERSGDVCLSSSIQPIVPGGRVTLGLVIAGAGYIITSEFISSVFFGK